MRGRLKDGGVNVVLKGRIARYLQACGYTPEAAAKEAAKYSGHSGRVGMYTAASEAGVAIDAVASLARHKSLNVAQKYARNADQLKRAVQEPGAGNLGARDEARRLRMSRSRSTVGGDVAADAGSPQVHRVGTQRLRAVRFDKTHSRPRTRQCIAMQHSRCDDDCDVLPTCFQFCFSAHRAVTV